MSRELLQQGHARKSFVMPCFQAVEINAGGDGPAVVIAAVPGDETTAGRCVFDLQSSDKLAHDVIYDQFDIGLLRQLKPDVSG